MSDPTERSGRDRGGDTGRGEDHGGRPCPRCGEAMVHRHCKYVCPIHGVVYDCSDTFY
ncbi:HVO_2523 family zinc finger protein [Halorubrum cibi]|uniref:HVO_2523 family zinc finger protein n=1 Tax=Halorubrum cibi TaxID=413815 RepID=UPI00163D69B7|nr:HVO_2523 family zinc finger protein [Halorubrum cibi]